MSWKRALHLHISGCDVQGHVTSSLQVKMLLYDWSEDEPEYFCTSHQIEKKKRQNVLENVGSH